jgi:uncharacterized membrane protein YgaE (UPF0421/DUF939 family)
VITININLEVVNFIIMLITAFVMPLIIIYLERKHRLKEEVEREKRELEKEAAREKREKEQKLKEEAEREKKMETLRLKLIALMKETPPDYELIHQTYNNYRSIGGNGFIEKQVLDFLWGDRK